MKQHAYRLAGTAPPNGFFSQEFGEIWTNSQLPILRNLGYFIVLNVYYFRVLAEEIILSASSLLCLFLRNINFNSRLFVLLAIINGIHYLLSYQRYTHRVSIVFN